MTVGFMRRIGHVLRAGIILADIALCFCWLAPLYLIGLADQPSGHQMISGYVGRAKLNGHRWARIAAAVIDRLLGKGHCVDVATRYAGFAD